MTQDQDLMCRHFNTYSGVKLPLNLLNELTPQDIANRNTYFNGYFDKQQRLVCCEKIVYGDVELKHDYTYHPNGLLKQANITDSDGELSVIEFDEQGTKIETD
ncbi:DUF6156 family protein [Thioflexithrix psekupsensis]|uniref:Uncharacterized protein n=1 Tax=Thioflexithrix psekupsensis TaxID=1570016 RepID=A0A251XBU1_9GAMM|nr:DUF6156 family protein [Thioflexithrix psekupsensis]OUD16197.1 hypothetical protein TPSD3_00270 [Thioflexithrix psekupsensis]